jgi:membrane protease YdiL (CAAX protease family)
MSPDVKNAVIKLVVPLVLIAVCLIAPRFRGISLGDAPGLRRVRVRAFLVWIALWVAWMVISEVAVNLLGVGQPSPWKRDDLLAVIIRAMAIGIAGPVAEEFVFRGVLYFRLKNTPLKENGTILVLAAVWAVIHYRYDWLVILFIFADGIILGFARKHTKSVLPPCVMHSLGNLFSVYQSLRG